MDRPLRLYPDTASNVLNTLISDRSQSFEESDSLKVVFEDDDTDIAAGIERFQEGTAYLTAVLATPTNVSNGMQFNYFYSAPGPDPFPEPGTDPLINRAEDSVYVFFCLIVNHCDELGVVFVEKVVRC